MSKDYIIKIDYKDIGQRIRKERKRLQLSQEKLGTLADLKANSVSHIENGTTKVSLASLISISRALNTPIEYFLCGNAPVSANGVSSIFQDVIKDCSSQEIKILTVICEATIRALRENKDGKGYDIHD